MTFGKRGTKYRITALPQLVETWQCEKGISKLFHPIEKSLGRKSSTLSISARWGDNSDHLVAHSAALGFRVWASAATEWLEGAG